MSLQRNEPSARLGASLSAAAIRQPRNANIHGVGDLIQKSLRRCWAKLWRRRVDTLPAGADASNLSQPRLDDANGENSPTRLIHINGEQMQKFCQNKITTGKYTTFSFLPKFLFEQFRRYSNCFFLFIAILQQIPDVSPTGRYTTLVPLILILTVSAVKEIVEDVKRHNADKEINHRQVELLVNGRWSKIRWDEVHVGDLVKVSNNNFFPADLLLLSSSEPQGMCFIETANLDGETNLKIRQAPAVTMKLIEAKDLAELHASVECELPNRQLYEFHGNFIKENGVKLPLNADQILLRGAMLRNTPWVFGFVIYTGHETKLMKNSTAAPLKRSTVDRVINKQILMLFIVLLVLSVTMTVCNYIWTNAHKETDWYVVVASTHSALNMLTFIILFNNLIPISLQVTLEGVRFLQAVFINYDIEMYHEVSDTPSMARTSNLNEELGMVKYIFSDKTGTLTRNEMVFKKCSIGQLIYVPENTPEESLAVQHLLGEHPNAGLISDFLTLLAVCHTVIPEKLHDDSIVYHAASPDERALVEGAKHFGYIFDTRTPEGVDINVLGEREHYEILNVIEFTSSRKRMSVIVRTPSGQIKLLCKGADNVIFSRLKEESLDYRESTLAFLEEFATAGLRTLCCAEAIITEEDYLNWNVLFQGAITSIDNRDAKIESVAELIEKNLTLLGTTAIEDRLQDEVPETISALQEAGIYIWMLTGDKQETAINIGYACHLITPSMEVLIINETGLDNVREVIHRYCSDLQCSVNKSCNAALVIDGDSLKYALTCELAREFEELCSSCRAVICCRVSPIQKAEVVDLVTRLEKSVTLAIGDGANDVAMIRKANVGVGISGMEGLQAACASDYSIAQFRFLKRLLLVHGVWNYRRITKLILYSFYKNVCLYVIELWFAMYSSFSGQVLFDRWTIGLFNVIFTAMPPISLGLFDKVCSAETMLKYPALYKPSQSARLFNVGVFWIWIGNALLHSVILFGITILMTKNESFWPNGRTADFLLIGNHIYTYVVLTVCLKAGLMCNSWNWITHFSIWGSVLSWLAFIVVYSNFWPQLPLAESFVGTERKLFTAPLFWFCFILVPFMTLLTDILVKVVKDTAFKSLTATVRELEISKLNPDDVLSETRSSFTETARLLRNVFIRRANTRVDSDVELAHGYAFSQEEGGAVSQADVIRSYNTNLKKPRGN